MVPSLDAAESIWIKLIFSRESPQRQAGSKPQLTDPFPNNALEILIHS